MRTRILVGLSFMVVLLSAPYLRGQDSMSANPSDLDAPSLTSSSTPQDTSGGPPSDFINVDVEPQIVKQAVPVYPEKALKDKLEGRVIVKLWVNKEGGVNRAIILKSSDPIFDQATVDAAMKYKFTPAILHDKPVGVWVVIPFTFKLKPDSTEKLSDDKHTKDYYYRQELLNTNKYWMSYQDMIKQYDAALYFERKKDYKKALKSYQNFVKESDRFPMRPEEMVRHAQEMIEKYSKMKNDGR